MVLGLGLDLGSFWVVLGLGLGLVYRFRFTEFWGGFRFWFSL